jgi:hypothetical protein
VGLQAVSCWGLIHPRPDLAWPQRSARVQAILDAPRDGPHRVITLRDLAVHPVGWLPNNGRWLVVLPR